MDQTPLTLEEENKKLKEALKATQKEYYTLKEDNRWLKECHQKDLKRIFAACLIGGAYYPAVKLLSSGFAFSPFGDVIAYVIMSLIIAGIIRIVSEYSAWIPEIEPLSFGGVLEAVAILIIMLLVISFT